MTKLCGCLFKCPVLLPDPNVNVYPVLPYCGKDLKYKQAAPKRVVITPRKPGKTFNVRFWVANTNKTSPTNIAMDLPYGVDLVTITGKGSKPVDVQVDELANTFYFSMSPLAKPTRYSSYKIKVRVGSLKLFASIEWQIHVVV